MGWDISVYVRSRIRKRAKVREIAAKMAPSYECELVEPDAEEEEEDEEGDDGFDLAFAFGKRAGGFSVERLKSGFRFYTDKDLAGDASEDVYGLMGLIGSKLGTVLDDKVDADAISKMIEEDEPEQERQYLDDALRNKALVRLEDRSGVVLGKLTIDVKVLVAAIDATGMLKDITAYPKLTEQGRASAKVARVQATLHDDYRAYRRHRWSCERDGRITDAKVEDLSD
jgi:hypothetical protein